MEHLKTLLFVLCLLCVTVILSLIVRSDPYDWQTTYGEEMTALVAFMEAEQAAEQGDAKAQFNLGVMYSDGRGVPQNDAEAVKWFRLAAEQGDASAQYNLGGVLPRPHGRL